MSAPALSIILPVLNEASRIESALATLHAQRTGDVELIVVDGGSSDDTPTLAAPLCDRVVTAPRGRARPMNAGAALARADRLLFLHADTRLPDGAIATDYSGCRPKLSAPGQPAADFRIDGPELHGHAGLVHLFGIESPGLTSSLAIAEEVVNRLGGKT